MKIEVWSDYVCPFCYIGKKKLEDALKSTGFSGRTELVFKAYQLDPTTPVDTEKPSVEGFAAKFGVSEAEAKGMMANIAEQAAAAGLTFNTDDMKVANTFNAHRLAKLAEQEGKGAAMSERLLKGHFTLGEALGNRDVLLRIAEETGISRDRAAGMLDSDEFAQDVRDDIAEAGQLGVRGVPFFVINRKYAISGAQPAEVFEQALKQAAEEEGLPAFKVVGEDEGGSCEGGSCSM